MPLDDAMSQVRRELTEHVAKKQDPVTLCQLILAVNVVLDVTEERIAKLQGHEVCLFTDQIPPRVACPLCRRVQAVEFVAKLNSRLPLLVLVPFNFASAAKHLLFCRINLHLHELNEFASRLVQSGRSIRLLPRRHARLNKP